MMTPQVSSGAIFAGIARNVVPYISKVLANIDDCASGLANKAVIVVENDSSDGTQEVLQRWASASKEHIYIRPRDMPSDGSTRTERLAHFRNIYLEEIEKEKYSGFEYVVIFDCDNIISSWIDSQAFIEAIQFLAKAEENAAAFANTRGFYYDVWTLRHPTWCPGDCWAEVERLSAFTSHTEAVLSCVGGRQIRIMPSSSPIPVRSAFGGLAIYKRKHLLGRKYSARNPDGTPACEHVALNESIFRENGRLFIFPQLLVRTPYEHIHRAKDKSFYRVFFREYFEERVGNLKRSFNQRSRQREKER
jgi:glycosyltransferase involved in cell wall biosynthesis